MWIQVLLRVLGYALTAVVAPILGAKHPEYGVAAGGLGGVLLNKATNKIIPRKKRLFPTQETQTSEDVTPTPPRRPSQP